MGFIPFISACLLAWPQFSRILTISARTHLMRLVPKPADQGRRAAAAGLCQTEFPSVGSFKIGRSLLSFLLLSFGGLCEKYTLLQNIMQYFIDPCKFSHPSDLLAAGSNNPGTYRNSAYRLRAQQQILPDTRAWTFTLWLQDGLFVWPGVFNSSVFRARRRH